MLENLIDKNRFLPQLIYLRSIFMHRTHKIQLNNIPVLHGI